jgi:hypothetical protein
VARSPIYQERGAEFTLGEKKKKGKDKYSYSKWVNETKGGAYKKGVENGEYSEHIMCLCIKIEE